MSLLASLVLIVAAHGGNVPSVERRLLLPFNYRGVRVTGGMLRKQLEDTKESYLRIPNDDLLLGFRRRAGLPAPGRELGGWYTNDIFHIFGQILSGLSRLYAATGDPGCKAKADALLDGWTRCIASDGYFYYSNKPNAPHYTYEKMVGGLVDMAIYGGRPDAMIQLGRITSWAEKHLDRKNVYAFNAGEGSTEWYTLSENLYRAYLFSGDERYRNFAKIWEFTDYWRLYANKQSIFSRRLDGGQTNSYHAYSHVNNLSGAALAYRVTGEPWYLDTIRNAYDYLQANECFATGGFGPNESLVSKERLKPMLRDTNATFETQCGTWAVFKLCKSLISLTGDARFGDWVEQLAYNGIGSALPLSPAGNVFYYSNYNPHGASKAPNPEGWTCCAGTQPMAIADICDLIYFRAPDGIDANLFVPSSLQFKHRGVDVGVVQETRFPEAPSTSFRFKTGKPISFTFRMRRPSWLEGPITAKLNGISKSLKEDGKHWLVINRTWRSGDRLEVPLPMVLHSVPLNKEDPSFTAIAQGPIVLAFRSQDSPSKLVDLAHLKSDFAPISGEPLNYRLLKDPNVLLRPFYEFKQGEPYYLYLDPNLPSAPAYRKMTTNGPWQDSGKHWFCNVPGAWCEGKFQGTHVTVLGYLYEDAGRAEVTVDGKAVGVIDEYNPKRDIPHRWNFSGFTAGAHKIRITVTPEKSPKSTNIYINIAGLNR